MTKQGEANRFGRFIFTDEQAERVAAGDMAAVWEFIEDNRKFLTGWARKFLRNRLSFLPEDMHGSFYKPEELINQIYVDFPYYKLESEKSLGTSIHCSFLGITCGGYRRSWHGRWDNEISIDTPISVSQRSGGVEEGNALKDLIPSREPIPSEVIERQEHVEEIAPRFYHEIGRLFAQKGTGDENGATVGEIIAFKEEKREKQVSAFQDVIEEVFFGYMFEEVKAYAKRTA